MILSKRSDVKTLTDLRTIIAMKWYEISGVKGRPENLHRIMNSDLSWQRRIEWIKRINEFKGKKTENIEWLTIIHNSEEIAAKLMESKSSKLKGDKNPGYQHNGKLSPWSKKSKFYSEESKQKAAENRSYNTRVDHYLKSGLGLCAAITALKERQAVGRLDKFIERYGETEGKKKWRERQIKWMNTLYSKTEEEKSRINSLKCSTGYTVSKAEKEIFSKLSSRFDNLKRAFPLSYNQNKNFYVYDIVLNNKIIEYNGDIWHANPKKFDENYINPISKLSAIEIWNKEQHKEKVANLHGYKILRVWETDYKTNPNKVIEECINFLKQ